MIVRCKKLYEDAVIPSYAHATTDAGMDLTAQSVAYDADKKCWEYGTGLAMEIPQGYVGLIFPRSSVYKTRLTMSNCVGVIDSGYRGEIMLHFYEPEQPEDALYARVQPYAKGDRIGQIIIMPYPAIELVEADELSDSDRGTNGHGSTGR